MIKYDVKELLDLLEKFHADDKLLNIIGGFGSEEDNTISDAISIINDALEKI